MKHNYIGALLLMVTTCTASLAFADDRVPWTEWDADTVEWIEEDHPYPWHFYKANDGIILLLSDDDTSLLSFAFRNETGFKSIPERLDSIEYLDDARANIKQFYGAVCAQCETLEERVAFVRPWEKKVFGALEYTKGDDGRQKLTLKADTDIEVEVINAFAELEVAHRARSSKHYELSYRPWLHANKDRIRVVDEATYAAAADGENDQMIWEDDSLVSNHVLRKLAPDGDLKDLPFFDAAYDVDNRGRYARAIKMLETKWGLGPDGPINTGTEQLDALYVDAAGYLWDWYLKRERCNANGQDNDFRGVMYSNANKIGNFPDNYRRFKGADLRRINLLATHYRDIIKYHKAGMTTTKPVTEISAEIAEFNAGQTPIVGKHWDFVPKPDNMKVIDGVSFWKYADCDSSQKCIIQGVKLEDPNDLTSKPLFYVSAIIPRSQAYDLRTTDPYDSNDMFNHFSRGNCGETTTRIIFDDLRRDRAWGLYRNDADVTDFTSISVTYGADGRLEAVDKLSKYPDYLVDADSDTSQVNVRELPTLRPNQSFKHTRFGLRDAMMGGPITYIVKRHYFRPHDGFYSYEIDNYFYEVLSNFQLKFDAWETLGQAFPEDADIIVELTMDQNVPHGPIKAWSYENGRKGILLADGAFERGVPVKK